MHALNFFSPDAFDHRRRERWLLLFALVFVFLNALALAIQMPAGQLALGVSCLIWLVVIGGLHVGFNRWHPRRDPFILPIYALLTGWGFILIARLALNFLWRQTLWFVLAALVLFLVAIWPRNLRWLRRYRYTWLTLGLILLATTLFFGVNPSGAGAALWLPLPFLDSVYFQPSELLKLLLLVFLASYFDEREQLLALSGRSFRSWSYLGPLLLMWGFCILLLIWQRDLGAASIFFILFLALLYLATGNWRYVVSGLFLLTLVSLGGYLLFGFADAGLLPRDQLAALGGPGRLLNALLTTAQSAYNVVAGRVAAWWNPWPDADNQAYQIVQALFAVAAGGTWGQGVAQGIPDVIPVVHSDFAFAAISEEWGLLGAFSVVLSFGLLAQRGLRIAAAAWRPFRFYLAAGIVVLFSAQAFLIMGGVTKLLPLTGVTLPFVSYGGSSLLVSSLMVGLLLNVSPQSRADNALEGDTGPLRPVLGQMPMTTVEGSDARS